MSQGEAGSDDSPGVDLGVSSKVVFQDPGPMKIEEGSQSGTVAIGSNILGASRLPQSEHETEVLNTPSGEGTGRVELPGSADTQKTIAHGMSEALEVSAAVRFEDPGELKFGQLTKQSGLVTRSPRFLTQSDVDPQREVSGPPPEPKALSAVSQLSGLLVMVVMMALFSLAYSSGSGRRLVVVLIIAVPGLAVVTKFSAWLQQRLQRKADTSRYSNYLRRVVEDSNRLTTAESNRRRSSHPPDSEIVRLVTNGERIWERRPCDHDFMKVSIGIGDWVIEPSARIDLSAAWDDEPRQDLLDLLDAERPQISIGSGVPKVLDLSSGAVCVAVGPACRLAVIAATLELVAFHGPDDLKISVPAGQRPTPNDLTWLRRVPHIVELPGEETTQALDALLEARRTALAGSAAMTESESPARLDRLVVVLDDFDVRVASDAQLELLSDARELGLVCVCLCEDMQGAPEGAEIVLRGSSEEAVSMTSSPDRDAGRFVPHSLDEGLAEEVANRLSVLSVRSGSASSQRSDSPGLFEMLGIEGPTDLGDFRAQEPNLEVRLGRAHSGKWLTLDLRQAALGGVGPHGMLAGSSGFGKSALLQIILAQLVLNNSPEQVSLLLIDYKGGEAFDSFAGLPHVSGLVTDIEGDASLLGRVKLSLEAELARRETALAEFRKARTDAYRRLDGSAVADDAFADCADYATWASRNGREPMPASIIVIDEFGELLSSDPEILKTFVSICRRGRSLGVHLLFSTQKVENRELAALGGHLGYRICLSMNSPSEFREMIGNRQAPEPLHLPGAAVVATRVSYTGFQAAYAGHRARSSISE